MDRGIFKNRCQRVKVNDKYSEWREVVSWITQGSVLEQLLFIIYIDDLPNCIDSMCRISADDTKVYRLIYSEKDQYLLQQDLLNLCQGVMSGFWSFLYQNVKQCKLEM